MMKRIIPALILAGILAAGCDNKTADKNALALPEGYSHVESKEFSSPETCIDYARARHAASDVVKVSEDTKVREMYAAKIDLSIGHTLVQACTTFQGETKYTLVEADHIAK